jgi:hypothetical protein
MFSVNNDAMNNMSSDKRRHERKDTITAIEYRTKGIVADEAFEGVICNISEAGFCLLSTNPLSRGDKIEIMNNQHIPSQEASVCWSSKCNGLYYKIGLQFV